ncbi:MAG TPA: LLM class flavin-dependent oxidoreductase [Ilumatobacteraceae bacterium]|nr:LLM class flavin-dependent oxidoreductase [Ilumatobacteraceae bacterium]
MSTPGEPDDARPLLSVLDLAVVSEGTTSGDALARTTALARRADELGYHRFWVAEHHNMPTVASTAPAVLIAHLAAATHSIRIGSGGVMLPNHAPLAVAEQFALLEALHPGRIDLGIGRAPGTDQATAAALRRSALVETVDDFPRDLVDLMGLLGDVRREHGMWRRFSATPVAKSTPMIGLLGSSGYSAQLAGMLGLPFAFAHHFDTGGTLDALDLYREHFRPSAACPRPHAIVTAGVLAADTDAEAIHLAGPGRLVRYGIRSGRFLPLVSPDDAATHASRDDAWRMPSSQILGSVATVMAGLADLVTATAADEVMLSTTTYGLAERIRSIELIADEWRLEPRA